METHQHDIVYYGVVNLVHESKIIGTVDVWRCRSCDEIFCEDKRFGATDLAPEVGFPRVEAGSKWAALVCTRNNASNWTLTGAKPGNTLVHSCTPETKLELRVGPDYSLESGPMAGIGQHRIILLEKFVNSAVDVVSGQKHTGTTDAYQALGKPFSFTPPLSAAVVESSKLQLFNISAGLFSLTGLWTLLGASMMPGTYQGLGLRVLLVVLGVASFVSAYLVFRKSAPGSIVALATVLAGLGTFTALRLPLANFVFSDYVLYVLLAGDLLVGWITWNRIRSIRASRWHPMDMPAYG
ncbi:MAG TPA: hypothetical protein VIH34_01050 [Candidatus Bathyarchaeia archaeon]